MIYTFYSYKGGVGRTMALANVAELFHQAGQNVLMVDWDLEAPGLERFFYPEENKPEEKKLESVLDNPGIMDLLLEYKEQMTRDLGLAKGKELPFKKPEKVAIDIHACFTLTGQDFEELKKEGIFHDELFKSLSPLKSQVFMSKDRFLEAIENHIGKKYDNTFILQHAYKDSQGRSTDTSLSNRLRLLTPGNRSQENFTNYANKVLTFDWQDFYKNWHGEAYIDWLRQEFERIADVILIDSRTGITEIGGICTYHLADVVVLFCAPNAQNIRGTVDMVKNFSNPKLTKLRRGRPLKTLVVPSRIQRLSQTKRVNQFYRDLTRSFAPLSSVFKQDPEFRELEIPYVDLYAYEEMIAITQEEGDDLYEPDLMEAYRKLAQVLARLAQDLKEGLQRKIEELTQQLGSFGQRLAELKRTRIFETHSEEKLRLTKEIENIEQERSNIERELDRLEREFQQFSDIPTI